MEPTLFYLAQGYTPGAPTQEAEAIDAAVAERTPCRRCGGKMFYAGYHTKGSYVAFAHCRLCDYSVEF